MVLNYHGIDISLERTTAALLSNSTDATPVAKLREFASNYFSSVRVKNSSVCEVIDSISRNNPVILLVDFGNTMTVTPRYIVVVGYDMKTETLVFHTGYSEFLKAPYEVINEKWTTMGSLAIFIENQL